MGSHSEFSSFWIFSPLTCVWIIFIVTTQCLKITHKYLIDNEVEMRLFLDSFSYLSVFVVVKDIHGIF